jgi:hypothetical protein
MNAFHEKNFSGSGYTDRKHVGHPAHHLSANQPAAGQKANAESLRQQACYEAAIWAELQFLGGEDYRVIEKAKSKLRLPTIKTPLECTDCSNLDAVLRNANMPINLRLAGWSLLQRVKKYPWLRMIDDGLFLNRVALLLAWAEFGFTIALCGHEHGRYPCRNVWECPLCNKHFKADEVIEEYADVYTKAEHQYAITFAYTSNPRLAGVWHVKVKGDKKRGIKPQYYSPRFNPFEGGDPVAALTAEDHRLLGDESPVRACLESFFKGMSRIMRKRLLDGAVLNREIAWHFVRGGKFRPYVKPNAHIYANRGTPLMAEDSEQLLWHVRWAYARLPGGNCLYPIVYVEELTSAKQVKAWLYYMIKPHKFVEPYQRAVAAGVSLPALNECVFRDVFQGGTTLLKAVRSPQRYGNLLYHNPGGVPYIGDERVPLRRKARREKQQERREARARGEPIPPKPRRKVQPKSHLEQLIWAETLAENEFI